MSHLSLKKAKPDIRYWWLLLLSGLMLLALGAWIFTGKLTAYLTISIGFAIGILGTGIMELLFIIFTRRASGVTRLALLGAFVDLFIGVYLWFYPLISLIIVPFALALWLILRGIIAIISALQVPDVRKFDTIGLTFGLLLIVAAAILLTNMVWGTQEIFSHTAAGFIVAGLYRVYQSFKIRKLVKDWYL